LGGEAGIEGIDEEAGLFDEDPLEGLNSEEGDVELSEQEIWKEMKRMLHFKERSKLAEGTSDEGSSFYGDDYLTDDDSEGKAYFPLCCLPFSSPRTSEFYTGMAPPFNNCCVCCLLSRFWAIKLILHWRIFILNEGGLS
jgi:hypothetical protein